MVEGQSRVSFCFCFCVHDACMARIHEVLHWHGPRAVLSLEQGLTVLFRNIRNLCAFVTLIDKIR